MISYSTNRCLPNKDSRSGRRLGRHGAGRIVRKAGPPGGEHQGRDAARQPLRARSNSAWQPSWGRYFPKAVTVCDRNMSATRRYASQSVRKRRQTVGTAPYLGVRAADGRELVTAVRLVGAGIARLGPAALDAYFAASSRLLTDDS